MGGLVGGVGMYNHDMYGARSGSLPLHHVTVCVCVQVCVSPHQLPEPNVRYVNIFAYLHQY